MERGSVVAIGQGIDQRVGTRLGDLKIVPSKTSPKKIVQVATALPDLDAIQVVTENPEQIAQRVAEIKELRAYAQKAADKVVAIRDRRAQIRLITDEAEGLTPALETELRQLDEQEERILDAGGNADMRERIYFSLLIADVKRAPLRENIAEELLQRAVDQGRFRRAEKDEVVSARPVNAGVPVGPQWFGGQIYVPRFDSRQDPGQFALEAELGKYLARLQQDLQKEELERVDVMLRSASRNLDQLTRGFLGRYAVPAFGPDGLVAGACLLSIEKKARYSGGDMTIISIVAGAGTLSWMQERAGFWISFGSYKRGVTDANLKGEQQVLSSRLTRAINDAREAWEKRSWRK